MGVIAKGILRGFQGLFTPVSLGYPLSVFNKNSTLIRTFEYTYMHVYAKKYINKYKYIHKGIYQCIFIYIYV